MSGSFPIDAHRDAATGFEYSERISRQRAAEHLVDIAYALTAGETLELRHDGEHVTIAVADQVLLIRRSTSKGGRVEVTFQLSWSSPDHLDPAG